MKNSYLHLSKIIGFTLSRHPIPHDDIDPFKANLSLVVLRPMGMYLYLWGIGDIGPLEDGFTYSLGFPPSSNRFERNVLLHLEHDRVVIENDWLGSIPVFYNKDTGVFSTLPLKTLAGDDDLDPIGLYLFLEIGHNSLNRTMFQRVRMLRYYSKIYVYKHHFELDSESLPLVFESMDNASSGTEQDAIDGIEHYLKKITALFPEETKVALNVTEKLSDRLLLTYFPDKSRLQAFSYDFQGNNSSHVIVKTAQDVSDALEVDFKTVHVDKLNYHIKKWFRLFGFSTNLHGSWQIESLYQLRLGMQAILVDTPTVLMTSLLGDAWGGGYEIPPIPNTRELEYLTFQTNLKIPSSKILIPNPEHVKSRLLSESGTILSYPEGRILTAIRINMNRMAYLTSLPEYFGFPVVAPFFNRDVAQKIFSIPYAERKQYTWLKRTFRQLGLYPEDDIIKSSPTSRQFVQRITQGLLPLQSRILGHCVSPWFVKKINNSLFGNELWSHILWKITDSTYLTPMLWRFGVERQLLNCLGWYHVLKPIEMSIQYSLHNPTLENQ